MLLRALRNWWWTDQIHHKSTFMENLACGRKWRKILNQWIYKWLTKYKLWSHPNKKKNAISLKTSNKRVCFGLCGQRSSVRRGLKLNPERWNTFSQGSQRGTAFHVEGTAHIKALKPKKKKKKSCHFPLEEKGPPGLQNIDWGARWGGECVWYRLRLKCSLAENATLAKQFIFHPKRGEKPTYGLYKPVI